MVSFFIVTSSLPYNHLRWKNWKLQKLKRKFLGLIFDGIIMICSAVALSKTLNAVCKRLWHSNDSVNTAKCQVSTSNDSVNCSQCQVSTCCKFFVAIFNSRPCQIKTPLYCKRYDLFPLKGLPQRITFNHVWLFLVQCNEYRMYDVRLITYWTVIASQAD